MVFLIFALKITLMTYYQIDQIDQKILSFLVKMRECPFLR